MFLHLGENVVVPIKDVIGIFDLQTSMYSSDTISFLRMAEEDGFVERISKESPKSFVIAEVNKMSKVYLSPISSPFLHRCSVCSPRRKPVTSIENLYSSSYHFFIT